MLKTRSNTIQDPGATLAASVSTVPEKEDRLKAGEKQAEGSFAALPQPVINQFVQIELQSFHPKSATTRLLSEANGKRACSHGASALPALLSKVGEYQQRFSDRVPPEVMVDRVAAFSGTARTVLEKYARVDSVFFFGSSVRGRSNANDVDMCCILKPKLIDRHPLLLGPMILATLPLSPLYEVGLLSPSAVPGIEKRLNRHIKEIAGLQVDISVKEDYHAGYLEDFGFRTPPGAHLLLQSGPLLCFARTGKGLGVCYIPEDPQFESGSAFKQKGPFSAPVQIVL